MPSRPNPAPLVIERRVRARGRRSLVAAVLIAHVAALAWVLLATAGLDPALLVLAAFAGWLVALALVWYGRGTALAGARSRIVVAAILAGWAVVGGMLLDWIVSITVLQGALGPADYVLARFGIVVPVLALAVGSGVAALRSR